MDKQTLTLKDRKRDEQAFRVYAREVGIAHIAHMTANFMASPSCPSRFDLSRIAKFQKQLLQVVAAFVEENRVESVADSLGADEIKLLSKGNEETVHALCIESRTKELEQLWPPLKSRGN
jgi:hypothetical protein